MFDFAISQQMGRRVSRRYMGSLVISCLIHFAAVGVLIEYPQLLGSRLRYWIRYPIIFAPKTEERNWRTVTVIGNPGKMQMPPAELLKKYVYDWSAHQSTGKAPLIRIRWSDKQDASLAETKEPIPALKPVPGTQEPKPAPETGSTALTAGVEPDKAAGMPAPGAATVFLPPPQPPAAPTAIPKKVTEPAGDTAARAAAEKANANPQPPGVPKGEAPKMFEDEKKALRTEGSGFFDTKGFPLGEYASLIIERVKGNWFIPSNLRHSQGRTTVVFFIDKDGRYTDARIVNSSGSNSLDLAALNAVIGSNPFPPLPKGFPGDHVGAKFVFSYNENQ
jgi:periplasmic protein TonB